MESHGEAPSNLAKKLAFLLQFSLVSFFGYAGIHGLVPAVMKTDSMDSDRFGLQLKNLKGPYFSIFIPSVNSLRSNICIRKNDILS